MKNSDWCECPNCHATLPVVDKSKLEGLVIGIYRKVRHGGVMHVGPIEKLIRESFDGYVDMVKNLHETDAGGGDDE